MPNIFSKALSAVTSAAELPTPPAFAPIAAILLPDSYKSDLTRIIRGAPSDFVNNREWWGEVRKVTGAKWADIKKVHSNVQAAASQPRANALDAIKKYTNTPLAQKDPALQKMLGTFGKRASSGKTTPEDLLKMQKMISARFNKLNERLTKALETQERLSRSSGGAVKGPPGSGETKKTDSKGKPSGGLSEWPKESKQDDRDMISEEILLENMFTDVVSKMSSFFASPQLTKIMAGEKYDKKRSQNLAKAAIFHLLQIVTDRAYDKLQTAGIDRKFMMKAWKSREESGNAEILAKASKLLGSDKFKMPTKKPPVQKTQPSKPERWRTEPKPPGSGNARPMSGAPPVQDGFDEISQNPGRPSDQREVPMPQVTQLPPTLIPENPMRDDGEPSEPAPVPDQEPKQQKPVSTGAVIYRKMMSAARAAKKAGQDPTMMAEIVLQRYEEAKIPEAAIVRRMFERATGKAS